MARKSNHPIQPRTPPRKKPNRMTATASSVREPQQNRTYTDDDLQALRVALRDMGTQEPTTFNLFALIQHLKPEMTSLREKGFSFDDIAAKINEIVRAQHRTANLSIPASSIRSYYNRGKLGS